LFGLFGTLPPDGKMALASSLPVGSVTDKSKILKYVGRTVTVMPCLLPVTFSALQVLTTIVTSL
jgi:hypothetical protein